MTDQEAHASRSSRARRPSERSRDADAQRREQLASQSDAAFDEADTLVATLRKLELISQSSRPDRRTIAFAVASLRGELPREPAAQAALFGLQERTLFTARADWVDEKDARLRQAMAYQALAPDERATFIVNRPSEEELAERAARKRQRLTVGAWVIPSCPPTGVSCDAPACQPPHALLSDLGSDRRPCRAAHAQRHAAAAAVECSMPTEPPSCCARVVV